MLLFPSQFPRVLARHTVEDSRRAPFSSSGIGLSRCWDVAAWAKFTAPRISSLATL
jgi:hypothetical protein